MASQLGNRLARGALAAAGLAILPALFFAWTSLAAEPEDEDPRWVNAACCVCHIPFAREGLSKLHVAEGITCIRCHGLSAGHANDENIGATPPDKTYKRPQIDAACGECHEEHDVPARKVLERWLQRATPPALPSPAVAPGARAAATPPAPPVCTDCHGHHRIEPPPDEPTREDSRKNGENGTAEDTNPKHSHAKNGPNHGANHGPEIWFPKEHEREAIAAGVEAGVGTATLEGPERVEVLSHQSLTLVYTAGNRGVRPGGGIRVGMRHLPQWTSPQTEHPNEPGYLTVKTSADVPTKVIVGFEQNRARFFGPYFAWQNMVEVVLPGRGLEPGETIRVTYGDQSGGSPGIRVQPFDERRFTFKVYADPTGEGRYFPLAENPAVEVVAAEPFRLSVVMPSDAVAGRPTWCIVRAEDRYGNPATKYRGTVGWKSTDQAASLPDRYTFTPSDRGVHRFDDVTFQAPGEQTLSLTDGALLATANPVRVADEEPEARLLWGDMHGHTLFSDGRGTVEEYYDFARNFSALDFCAVSDHAFEIVDEMWTHSKKVTNAVNEPDRFVTLQAYEWSGTTKMGGDHNLYFLDDDPPLYRSASYDRPENLQMDHGPTPKVKHVTDVFDLLEKQLRDKNVFCIPHFGGRRGNPGWHRPSVQRMIEIFSEHRRSEDWATTFLTEGHRLGIMASTDGHYGNPGHGYLKPTYDWDTQEIGMAAVAVYAAEHTRESIFRALYDRHTYATSGSRIRLAFHADGHPMGSEYETEVAPTLTVEVVGTAPVARIEIKRQSKVVKVEEPGKPQVSLEWTDPDFQPGGSFYYYVRVVQEDGEEAISSPVWVN